MPQKACERWFCHVMAFVHLFEMPQNRKFHFRFLFCSKIDHVRIIRNAPIFYVRNIWNAPSFLSDSENGALRFWSISNKWANAITWQNHLSHAFWGISYYSPYHRAKDESFKSYNNSVTFNHLKRKLQIEEILRPYWLFCSMRKYDWHPVFMSSRFYVVL